MEIKLPWKKEEVKEKTKVENELDALAGSLGTYSGDSEEYGVVVRNLSGLEDIRKKEIENAALEASIPKKENAFLAALKKIGATALDPKVWAAALPVLGGLFAWFASTKREEEEKLSKPESFKYYDSRGFK